MRLLVREVTLPKGKLPAAAAAFARARDTPPPARDADAAALVAWTEAGRSGRTSPDTLGQHLPRPLGSPPPSPPTHHDRPEHGRAAPGTAHPHAATMDGQPLIAHCPIVTLPMAALADELVRRRARPANGALARAGAAHARSART
ncbi:MAG: hypothetical protein U0841_29340 [Chloroflexia bacterium]